MEIKKFEHMRYKAEDIGPNLLESITKGLYINPLHTIREYVQNEVESGPPRPTKVKIRIEGENISIWGDGGGMDRAKLEIAKRIGFSTKSPEEYFGFRGIGLWSGIAVCDTILISTKRKGDVKKYLVKIDAKGIRKEIENRVNKPLTHVLTDHVTISETSADADEHGTHVQLLSILEECKEKLLSLKEVEDYLALTLPVDFDPKFKYRKEITKMIKEHVPDYRVYKTYLNDEPVYRPPYIGDIDSPQPILIRRGKKGLIGFCWVCLHKSNKVIEEAESRGLIYKKKGFTVGDKETCVSWWGATHRGLIWWAVGEIHVIDPKMLPDSERMDFESSPAKDHLIKRLVEQVKSTVVDGTRRNSFIKRFNEKIQAIQQMSSKPVFMSEEEKEDKISEVTTELKSLKRDLKNTRFIKFVSDDKVKLAEQMVKKAIELRGIYRSTKVTEVEKPEVKLEEITKPTKTLEVPTKFPIEIAPKERFPLVSLVDLTQNLKVTEQARLIIDSIDRTLDEYFSDDTEACLELKQKIAIELDKILPSD